MNKIDFVDGSVTFIYNHFFWSVRRGAEKMTHTRKLDMMRYGFDRKWATPATPATPQFDDVSSFFPH